MNAEELASAIDHTILRPDTTSKEIGRFIGEALVYPFASLCIPPFHLPLAVRLLRGTEMRLSSVVGFPLGYQSSIVKLREAEEIIQAGGNEIDMVMNLGAFKSGERHIVADEIEAIVKACRGMVVKVIIETCLLSTSEKRAACRLIAESGAHFVKTSTGFSTGGATVDDVALLREAAAGQIQVKASGGIRNLDSALAMIEAGASRIGTSMGVQIVEEQRAR
ncbi:MAG: deoxyribose-phosphate aldolase [Thermodesulfobacteriota bacterium]